MSLYTARTTGGGTDAIGTTLPTFRLGLTGPTFYNGSADPTSTPPTPMDDGFSDGDIYIRTAGGSSIWVYDTAVWSQLASTATGNVSKVGTPVDNQIGVWTGDGTIEGDTGLTWDGTTFTVAGFAQIENTSGVLTIQDSNTSGASATARVNFRDSAITNMGNIGFSAGGSLMQLSNQITDGDILISTSGANSQTIIRLNGTEVARSLVAASGGLEVNNTSTGAGFERVLTTSDIGAGGDVLKVGTPVNNQIGVWTGDGTLEGDTAFTFDGTAVSGTVLWRGGDGTAALPAVSFSTDIASGMFSPTSDVIGFSAATTEVFRITSNNIQALDGVIATPAYSFANETNTGMYLNAAGELGLSVLGTERLRVTAVDIRSLEPIAGAFDATAALPAFTSTTDPDTGMFFAAANELGFSTGASERLRVNSGGIAVTGGLTTAITSTAAATLTLDGTHSTVVGTLAGAQTFTLPTAVGIDGRIYNIKKTGASGTLTVDTTSSQTIDGSLTFATSTQYLSITVQSDGANWIII